MKKWNDMTPRERDALVAWRVMENPAGLTHTHQVEPLIKCDGECTVNPLPYFTTDIKAAWEVVEKLNDQFELRFLSKGIWEFEWTTGAAWDGQKTFGKTAPEAICKAALRAKGVDI